MRDFCLRLDVIESPFSQLSSIVRFRRVIPSHCVTTGKFSGAQKFSDSPKKPTTRGPTSEVVSH
jgi:hypothetical protein